MSSVVVETWTLESVISEGGVRTRMAQSRTGGVLVAVPRAAVMGASEIFFQWRKIHGCKKLPTFLVVALKTQVFAVTTNVQNTLQHSGGDKCPQNISFFRRGRLYSSKGSPVPWHNGTMVSASLYWLTRCICDYDTRGTAVERRRSGYKIVYINSFTADAYAKICTCLKAAVKAVCGITNKHNHHCRSHSIFGLTFVIIKRYHRC